MKPLELHLREWSVVEPDKSGASPLTGRSLDSPHSRQIAEVLRRSRLLEIEELSTGLRVRSFSHVGRVRVGDLVITIEPKVGPESLLALLRYAFRLRDLSRSDASSFGASGRVLQDLLAEQLLAEMEEILGRGLPRRYVERTERLPNPRGRIDFLALARSGAPTIDLVCSHHPRSADHLLTRVLAAGVALAAEIASDTSLRVSLQRLHGRLSTEIPPVELSSAIIAQARRSLTRLVSACESALQLVELLRAGRSAALDDEDALSIPGFLFDMNRFFQALVGRWLHDHLDDFVVRDEHALRGMMRYLPNKNPRNKRAPLPRPDFLVLRGKTPLVLLDAKYRDLWELDLPREMLYQLGIYTLNRVGDGTAAIIYPTVSTGASESIIEIRDTLTGETTGQVALRPLVLPELVTLLADHGKREARRALALRLAFGDAGG